VKVVRRELMFRTRSRFDDLDITDHVRKEIEGTIKEGVLSSLASTLRVQS